MNQHYGDANEFDNTYYCKISGFQAGLGGDPTAQMYNFKKTTAVGKTPEEALEKGSCIARVTATYVMNVTNVEVPKFDPADEEQVKSFFEEID